MGANALKAQVTVINGTGCIDANDSTENVTFSSLEILAAGTYNATRGETKILGANGTDTKTFANAGTLFENKATFNLSFVDVLFDWTTGGAGTTINVNNDSKFQALTISAGDTLNLSGQRAEFTGTLDINGAVDLTDSLIYADNLDYDGTSKTGTADVIINGSAVTLDTFSGNIATLVINSPGTVTLAGNVAQLATDLIISAGTFDLNDFTPGTTTALRNIVIAAAGTLDAGAATIPISGNWTSSGGLISKSALNLDGYSQFINVSPHATHDISGNISVEAWVKLDELHRVQTILSAGPYSLKIGADNYPYFELINSSNSTMDVALDSYAGSIRSAALVVYNGTLYSATGVAYGGGTDKFSRYNNDGTWTNVSNFADGIWGVVNHNGTLFAGCNDGHVYKYNGAEWSSAGQPTGGAHAVASTTVFNEEIYTGHANGEIRRYNGGTSWSDDISGGSLGADVYVLTEFNNTIFAGDFNGKVWRYDGGTTWTDISGGGLEGYIGGFTEYNGKLIAGVDGGVHSYDGSAWTDLGHANTVYAVVVYNGELYASNEDVGAGIYRYDGGTSWTTLDNEFTGPYWAVTYDGKVFLGAGDDIEAPVYTLGEGLAVYSSEPVTKGRYTHIAGTYDGSIARIYVDGKLTGTREKSITLNTTSTELLIGKSYGSSAGGITSSGEEALDGVISRVALWNESLNQSDVRNSMFELCNNVSAQDNLVGCWEFSEAAGTNTSDYTGTNDGNATDASIWAAAGTFTQGTATLNFTSAKELNATGLTEAYSIEVPNSPTFEVDNLTVAGNITVANDVFADILTVNETASFGALTINEGGSYNATTGATAITNETLWAVYAAGADFNITNLTTGSTTIERIQGYNISLIEASTPGTTNYHSISKFINITNTSTGSVNITLSYTTLDNEANAKIYKWDGSSWTALTSTVDTANNLISASDVTSFSIFAGLSPVVAAAAEETTTPTTGGTPAPATTATKTATFSNVAAGQTLTVKPASTIIKVTEITAVAAESAETAKITVKNHESAPATVSAPPSKTKVYQYLDITSDVKIEKAEIKFTVSDSWLDENKAEEKDVVLLHYDGADWNDLPTEHISGEEYKATTPSFSTFAISAKVAASGEGISKQIREIKEQLVSEEFRAARYAFLAIFILLVVYYNREKLGIKFKKRAKKEKIKKGKRNYKIILALTILAVIAVLSFLFWKGVIPIPAGIAENIRGRNLYGQLAAVFNTVKDIVLGKFEASKFESARVLFLIVFILLAVYFNRRKLRLILKKR